MKCPKCNEIHGIIQIPKYQYPVSTAFPLLGGWYALILFPALPSRFRCTHCGNIFRKYTASGYTLLAAIIFAIGLPLMLYVAQWAIYLVRYLGFKR